MMPSGGGGGIKGHSPADKMCEAEPSGERFAFYLSDF